LRVGLVARLQQPFIGFHCTLKTDMPLTLSNTLRYSDTSLVSTRSVALPSMMISSSAGTESGRGSGKTTAYGWAVRVKG